MLERQAVIGDSDTLQAMQRDALRLAGKALDGFEAGDSTDIARLIKKTAQEFDRSYGPGWQCIVGTDFGSFVTHRSGCFIYFDVGNLAILLFRVGGAATAGQAASAAAAGAALLRRRRGSRRVKPVEA
ncbi:hypothetical protein ACP70R_004545 [Stipagrostis hirtigluma subsp. patula]